MERDLQLDCEEDSDALPTPGPSQFGEPIGTIHYNTKEIKVEFKEEDNSNASSSDRSWRDIHVKSECETDDISTDEDIDHERVKEEEQDSDHVADQNRTDNSETENDIKPGNDALGFLVKKEEEDDSDIKPGTESIGFHVKKEEDDESNENETERSKEEVYVKREFSEEEGEGVKKEEEEKPPQRSRSGRIIKKRFRPAERKDFSSDEEESEDDWKPDHDSASENNGDESKFSITLESDSGNSSPKYQCEKCNSAFLRVSWLEKHMSSAHGENPPQNRENSLLKYIIKDLDQEKPYKCTLCCRRLRSKFSSKIHVRKMHNIKIEQEGSSKEPLLKQIRIGSSEPGSHVHKFVKEIKGSRPFCCVICKSSFKGIRGCRTHIRDVHQIFNNEDKNNPCSHCSLHFSSPSTLRKHMLRDHRSKTVSREWDLQCKDCGKCFPDVTHLRQHTLIHSGDKPFKCSDCDKSFRLRHHLTRHVKSHHS